MCFILNFFPLPALGKFRKTVLGVEKYRINNPSGIADKYCEIIKTCLRVPDSWGAAANALEYAGLQFREHVTELPINTLALPPQVIEKSPLDVNGKIPVMDLTSFWKQALVRLLDM